MDVLKTLFDIWVVVGMVIGIFDFNYFYRKIRLGSWTKRVLITLCLGPFWWIMMPLVYFTTWVTK